MKRRGFLIEQICDMDNLRLAYWKAKRGKGAKREVLNYSDNLHFNLLSLRDKILSGKVPEITYNTFTIYDPKERIICATPFEQRVLQHALMNICHPDFERYQTNDSFASRLGRGTYAALNRAILNQKKYRYCLKLDIRKYFDSIHHDIVKNQLRRMYKDRSLLNIFEQIIDSYEVYDACGLPIGNLTSQYFANHYLAVADHFVREELHVDAYVRYMDDMLLWGNDRSKLKEIGALFRAFVEDELKLKFKVFSLNPTDKFCTFLGYRISRYHQCLSRCSLKRYQQKLNNLYWSYNQGAIGQKEMNNHLLPLIAFTYHVSSKYQREIVMSRI